MSEEKKATNKSKRPTTNKIMQSDEDFNSKKGKLFKLGKGNFQMKTKEGQKLWCDYQIANWELKKIAVDEKPDPKSKLEAKIAKKQEEMKKLEGELKDLS